MAFIDTLTGWFKPRIDVGPSGELQAATQLAPVEDPKVKKGPISVPSHLKTATPGDSVLPRQDRRLANTNIETYRNGSSSRTVLRDFIAASPDLSAAVSAYIRTSITSGYLAVAKDLDGTFNPQATQLLQQILTRFDVLGDYKDGFCGISSMRSNSESLVKECMSYGAMGLELVLDKARLPRKLAPVSVTTVEFKSDGENLTPQQKIGSEIRDLDIPTFFYVALDQDLLEPYSASPLEPAIQPVLFSIEFMNDLRRIVKRSIHPRLDVKIVWELFKNSLPSEAAHDPDKLRDFMNLFIADLQSRVNDLKPEDAMVHFDSVEMNLLNNGNTADNKMYEVLSGLADAKVATGAKTLPAILGHGSGSQNIASTETMLFMQAAEGVQQKLNEIYSRALTLAVRLFGFDVYVEFRYNTIDLRPESELESFRQMRQDRILMQLSLGLITDEQASLQLTGSLPPPGAPKLSGTMFMTPGPSGAQSGNPTSTTGARQGQGGAMNQNLKPATPANNRGS